MNSHEADEWFAKNFTGKPTDQREIIRAAYDAGARQERERAIAICNHVSLMWLDGVARSAANLIREQIANEGNFTPSSKTS